MNKTINLILAILSVITYIGIIVMKFYTQINIPNGSFVIMTLLFIISVCQFFKFVKIIYTRGEYVYTTTFIRFTSRNNYQLNKYK
mgnify:CR=1 FL=1